MRIRDGPRSERTGKKSGRKRYAACDHVVEESGFAFLRKSPAVAARRRRPAKSRRLIHSQIKTEQPLRGCSVFGGGEWIRTTEGEASRFTVCPLWPLGYSSVFNFEKGGAGGRIRTPDLLITNQLLYQLSYTSTQHPHSQRSLL